MLILIGCNHRSAPVALRERLGFAPGELERAFERLRQRHGVDEAVLLSTCNRVEVLARTDRPKERGIEAIKSFLSSGSGVAREELERHVYAYVGNDAVRHMFRVAAGLDSMILGEPQILGQVKQAYAAARSFEATGPVLDRLMQQCLASAKRVRTQTGISRNPVSVAFAAANLAKQIFNDLHGRSGLVIGGGKMGALVARHLCDSGIERIGVTSRSYTSAVEVADRIGGEALHWDDGLAQLGKVDIVVTSTGSPHPILSRELVADALRTRRGRPLFMIDIAVPRDIDPEVNRLDDVYLYDIDALQGVVDANIEERRRAAGRAQQEIDRDVEEFDRWRQSLEITPTIVTLREKLSRLGRGEFERARRRLGRLSPEQEQAIEGMTRSLIQKILHQPILYLRKSVDRGDVGESTSAYRDIFGLDAPPESPGPGEARDDDEQPPSLGPQRLLRGGRED